MNKLYKYMRNRKGQLNGVVLATVVNNTVRTGWSKCNESAGDIFDKERAILIAEGRAKIGLGPNAPIIPRGYYSELVKITKRGKNYFKVPVYGTSDNK